MKKILPIILLCGKGLAMEPVDIENQKDAVAVNIRPSSQEIIDGISAILSQYNSEVSVNNDQFKQLVIQYFKKESVTIESNIIPHLERKLRDSDADIQEILEKDDKAKLKKMIHSMVTDSIEEAFKEKDLKYDELKQIADNRLKRSRYALITAIVSGISGALAVFFGVFFGRG